VKYVGAAYLVFVGIRKLLGKDEPLEAEERAPRRRRRVLSQGVVVNVLNPKTALFFLAFLPQFVDPDRPVWTQTGVLGLCWIGLGLISDGAYALLGGTIGGVLRRRRKAVRYASGGIFVGLGAVAATSGRRPGALRDPRRWALGGHELHEDECPRGRGLR